MGNDKVNSCGLHSDAKGVRQSPGADVAADVPSPGADAGMGARTRRRCVRDVHSDLAGSRCRCDMGRAESQSG